MNNLTNKITREFNLYLLKDGLGYLTEEDFGGIDQLEDKEFERKYKLLKKRFERKEVPQGSREGKEKG